MMDKEVLNELIQIEDRLDELLPKASKHKIEELQRRIAKVFVRRFAGKRRIPKYGRLSKAFSESDIQKFFAVVDDKKLLLLYKFMSQLALRISEVCVINIKDINLETKEIKIFTEKAQLWDTLIVPNELFQETLDFINQNQAQVESSGGYLFFADKRKSSKKLGYLDSGYVRIKFREYVIKAGIDEIYGVSDELKGREMRHLHRLSSHSLRHYAITRFARQTKDPVLTSRFSRHASIQTTMGYIANDKVQLYEAIQQSTGVKEVIALKERIR